MKKHWKEIVFILPSLAVAVVAGLGLRMTMPEFPPITYPEEKVVKAAEESPAPDGESLENTSFPNDDSKKSNSKNNNLGKKLKKMSYTRDGIWKDGTYTGSGTGFGGLIEVSVTIAGGEITDIQIISCAGETPSYLEKAKGVIPQMLAAQSPNVDMVSGATYSSNGIRNAVIRALNKAGGNLPTVPESKPKSTSQNKKKSTVKKKTTSVPKGKPADGVYSGSAVCERFGYTVSLKVRFKDGKATSLYGLKITGNKNEANEAYWKKAWKPMVKRILKAQNTEVDAVSGATYSSNAILKAYQNARAKALGVEKNNDNKNNIVTPTSIPAPSPSISPTPSVLPVPSDSGDGNGDDSGALVKDGTYTASAMVVADEWEEFADYSLTADVTFSGGKLTGIANLVLGDTANQWYCNAAANGYGTNTGIIQQLIDGQDGKVDAVSGATCSSMALIQIYNNALEMATK